MWDERIEDFINYLRLEKNASQNTIEAYLQDICKLKIFATEQLQGVSPIDISYENLQEFLFQTTQKEFRKALMKLPF